MNYQEALDYIHSVTWMGSRPGLSRTQELTERIGRPQDSLRFIHVAGTNGKGSVCAMLSSILTAAGYKTGLFTSPYITEFNERIRFCGENESLVFLLLNLLRRLQDIGTVPAIDFSKYAEGIKSSIYKQT